MGTASQGVKASAALFFAMVVTKGIAYIATPFYTRLLTAEEYGQASVFLTCENLFGIVAMFCLSYGVFNNGMMDFPDRRDEYSFSMLVLSNLITVGTFGLLLCFYPWLKQLIGLDWPLMLLMGAVFLLQPAYNFWTSRQRYELRYKATVLWTIALALLSPIAAILCIRAAGTGGRLYGRIFGAESVMLVAYAGFYIYLAIRAKGRVEVRYWKAALLFNLPLIPHYLSSNLLASSDKLMISRLVSDAATAHYSVAYSVASVASIVWSAINASLVPYTYEKCKAKDHAAIARVTKPLLLMVAAICLMVIVMAPEVVAIMATADYKSAIYVIPPVVGGVFFQVHYFIYANIVYYYKRPKYVMYASVISTVLNIALNYVFIRRYGFIAAGYTTLVCYIVQAAIDYVAMKRVVGDSVYDMRVLGVLSLAVVVVALTSNLLYDYVLTRYVILVALLALAVRYRSEIIGMLRSMKNDMGSES